MMNIRDRVAIILSFAIGNGKSIWIVKLIEIIAWCYWINIDTEITEIQFKTLHSFKVL